MASCHRVFVTGASGLLGRAVMRQFSNADCWKVLGVAHSRARGNLKKLDLLDFEETKRVVQEFKPHVIIHCAAERRPDIVENNEELAMKMNVGVTEVLAKAMNDLNHELEIPEHFMLYISTDYVFDGTSPPYRPEDEPNPLNKYGKSKLQGELVMQNYHPDGGILRVPILYGKVEKLNESAVTVLFEAVKRHDKPAVMDDHQVRFPTLVDDVAAVCRCIADKCVDNGSDFTITGVWHWSSIESMTKYNMAVQMAEVFCLPHDHLSPNKAPTTAATVATRPHNAALDCSELESMLPDGGATMRASFKEAIKACLEPFV